MSFNVLFVVYVLSIGQINAIMHSCTMMVSVKLMLDVTYCLYLFKLLGR